MGAPRSYTHGPFGAVFALASNYTPLTTALDLAGISMLLVGVGVMFIGPDYGIGREYTIPFGIVGIIGAGLMIVGEIMMMRERRRAR